MRKEFLIILIMTLKSQLSRESGMSAELVTELAVTSLLLHRVWKRQTDKNSIDKK